MKYTIKPQKALLIAGMTIASYAQACYYQTTHSFYCALKDDHVDKITWVDGTTSDVTAAANWQVLPTSSMVYTSTGAGGRTSVVNGGTPHYCKGDAWVVDHDHNFQWEVNPWMGNSVTPNLNPSLPNPYYSGASTTTGGGTCQ